MLCTGRATPGWIAWPTHHSIGWCNVDIHPKCTFGGEICNIGQVVAWWILISHVYFGFIPILVHSGYISHVFNFEVEQNLFQFCFTVGVYNVFNFEVEHNLVHERLGSYVQIIYSILMVGSDWSFRSGTSTIGTTSVPFFPHCTQALSAKLNVAGA